MEFFTAILGFVTGNWQVVLEVIGGFALLATVTPNKVDDEVMQKILTGVNFMGANLGKAKNS